MSTNTSDSPLRKQGRFLPTPSYCPPLLLVSLGLMMYVVCAFLCVSPLDITNDCKQKKYDWAGKQKGSSLLANTPAKPLPKSDEE